MWNWAILSSVIGLVGLGCSVADDGSVAETAPEGTAATATQPGRPGQIHLPPGTIIVAPAQPLRTAPPEASGCITKDQTPTLSVLSSGKRSAASPYEVHGGADKSIVDAPSDHTILGVPPLDAVITTTSVLGVLCVDADKDGWYDGACNERRKLFVDRVVANHTQEFFHDEIYFVADDVRHPQPDLHGTWEIADHGGVVEPHWLVASRVRGVNPGPLALVSVELWEDDWDPFGQWIYDDFFGQADVDLSLYKDGETFTRKISGDGYDYDITFRVTIEHFADPTPGANGDADKDGISEATEASLNRELGGILDPTRPDVLVEVNWMTGHQLRTEAKRQVVTQYYRNGIALHVQRDQEIPLNPCLTVPAARDLYKTYFQHRDTGAYRYAVIGEKIWNNASGVMWGDIFLVNDATWWINNWVLPQAGTFIHELGHTMGLTKDGFHMIDSINWPTYESAMNYLYQAILVNYSSTGTGSGTDGYDHDDWAVVNAAYALQWSFAMTTATDVGICK